MRFIFNPDAEEFIPKAEEENRHSGQCFGYSVERGEAGHSVGKQTPRPRGRDAGRLGLAGTTEPSHRKSRYVPGYETESPYRDRRDNTAKKTINTAGSDHASSGRGCSTRDPSETEGGTCDSNDLQWVHPDCKREKRVWICRVRVDEGSATWL